MRIGTAAGRQRKNRRGGGRETEEPGTRRDQSESQRREENPSERGVPRAEIETKRRKKNIEGGEAEKEHQHQLSGNTGPTA